MTHNGHSGCRTRNCWACGRRIRACNIKRSYSWSDCPRT